MKEQISRTYLLGWMKTLTFLFIFFRMATGFAQLSPGDLTEVHAQLEGLSNCTECHILGNKVSNEKCLHCHQALNNRIEQKKGYHASAEILGKACVSCHSDHHGKKFEIIRFDKDNFRHNLTGYELLGAHKKLPCSDCHKKEFIADADIKKKKTTFLGLNPDCLSCHANYHQNTLPSDCKQCHNDQAFKPASKFNHDNTKFPLKGKHQDVACSACHKTITLNGKEIRQFSGIAFASCTNCHADVHHNQFGQNCSRCHTVQSFRLIKGMSGFNHDQTGYKLEGKHRFVKCKACHKTKYTDPLKHNRCTDCHNDYHQGQLVQKDQVQDCSDCHSTKGFSSSTYTIGMHNKTAFLLDGAHLATPCFACHKKTDKWDFRNMGHKCTDCHDDIHKSLIDEKYYPQEACENCHDKNRWDEIHFDHSQTGYELQGKHREQSCRACHFKSLANGGSLQQFKGLTASCTQCHKDEHHNQFAINGKTDCTKCHGFNNWNAGKFNHNNTRFPLDGKHKDIACSACHKKKQDGAFTYIQYKLNDITCASCH